MSDSLRLVLDLGSPVPHTLFMATKHSRVSPTETPTDFYFGRCSRPGEPFHRNSRDLSQNYLPMVWSDEYADRCVAKGRSVEKVSYITVKNGLGDMVKRRVVVEVLGAP